MTATVDELIQLIFQKAWHLRDIPALIFIAIHQQPVVALDKQEFRCIIVSN